MAVGLLSLIILSFPQGYGTTKQNAILQGYPVHLNLTN